MFLLFMHMNLHRSNQKLSCRRQKLKLEKFAGTAALPLSYAIGMAPTPSTLPAWPPGSDPPRARWRGHHSLSYAPRAALTPLYTATMPV